MDKEHTPTPPSDVIVRPELVVTKDSWRKILEEMNTAEPTDALRELLREGDGRSLTPS